MANKKQKKERKKGKGKKTSKGKGVKHVESKSHKVKNQSTEYIIETLPVTASEPVDITFAMGFTMRTADFETVRCYLGIKLPTDPENIEAVYTQAQKWVEGKLGTMSDEVTDMVKE